MSTAIELFVIGITASFGPCFVFCSPIILPYIASTRHSWQEGLSATLIILVARLVAYSLFGLLAGGFGRLFIERLQQFEYLVFLLGGLFIAGLGLLITLGKEPTHRLCQILRKQVVDDSIKGPILLGLVVGILPCLPLLGVLAYIALTAQNLLQGAFYGLAFGLGKFISPLIPLGVLASILPAGLIKNQKIYVFFSRVCGFILFLIGVNLVVSKV